jgi:hypothetical protein
MFVYLQVTVESGNLQNQALHCSQWKEIGYQIEAVQSHQLRLNEFSKHNNSNNNNNNNVALNLI